MSDHQAILCDIRIKAKMNKKKPRTIFLYDKMNKVSLKQQLRENYNVFKDSSAPRTVEDNWNNFKNILHQVMTDTIPRKNLTGRTDVPWMTYKIKRRLRRKQRLYNKARRTNNETDWKKFKEARKEVKTCLENSHNEYVMSLLEPTIDQRNTSMTKKFWRYVKNQKRDNCGISPLTSNGQVHEDSKGKAEVLNCQFQSVFTEEDTTQMPKLPDTDRLPSIEELQISAKGVQKLLESIDPKKASGPDEVPCRVMKEAAEEIAPFLRDIYHQSLQQGTVPEDWRSANISCIYKKGDRTRPENYRPVSLTSVPCKIFEHIIFHHIMKHLDQHKFLVDYQHGFRRQRSCETQLVVTVEELARSLDNKTQTDMLILDFSKAFDTVAHQRLLLKLEHYGIRGQLLEWIRSWLTTRRQKVVVDGERSSEVPVKSGVPQGTVLGPLMFLLFVNDIGRNISSKLRLFADDTLLYREIKNKEDTSKLQQDLNTLEKWSKTWQMRFNPKKCVVQRIYKTRQPVIKDYQLMGHTLEAASHSTYLGVELARDLSWNEHINRITTKANRSLGFIRRNLNKCPEKVKEQAYIALVRPHLEYACCAWDPYLKKHVEQLDMIQRRSARFVKNNYRREEGTVTSLLEHLKWKTLQQRREQFRLLLMFKMVKNLIGISIPHYVSGANKGTRGYHELRFRQLSTNTDMYKYSFLPRTICQWNLLPPSTLECATIDAFRQKLNA